MPLVGSGGGCVTRIPAKLQDKAMIFVIKRLYKRTTVD
jgi:hypothetical protein